MDTLQVRVKRVRTELGASAEEIAQNLIDKGIKISARSIYSYELNERQPSTAFLQGLVDTYDISAEWLLSGRGEMYSNPDKTTIPASFKVDEMVFIPLLDMAASAGYGSVIEEKAVAKDFVAFAKKWLRTITIANENHLLMFSVRGDSMLGQINDGDLIMVNDTMTELSNDGTYVVCIDNQLYVKILQRMPGNKVQVISKNTKYAPFTVDLDSEYFQIIGKVVWSGGKVDVC